MRPSPIRRAFALALFAAAAGCGKGVVGDPPSIAILTPEEGSLARHYIAVSGEATGNLARVEVQIDDTPARIAHGLGTWSLTVDVTTIADGAHSVKAIATDHRGRTAETLPVSFISAAHQAANTRILAGGVTGNSTEAVAGAVLSLFDDPALSTVADATGAYALVGVPLGGEPLVKGSASGFIDTYLYRVGGSADSFGLSVPLYTRATVDSIVSAYGGTWSPGTAVVLGLVVNTAGTGAAGTTVTLVPPPAPGGGPFYIAADGSLDPSLTSASAAGVFVAFNVPAAGPVTLVASNGAATFFVAGSEAVANSLSILVAAEAPVP
ncbi:MAG TPA: Ig-like domain-containing protein [bacterium]|nr:Ig-like domain-containing protein [bacterium]